MYFRHLRIQYCKIHYAQCNVFILKICIIPFYPDILFLIFSGKCSSLYDKDDPDWLPSLNMRPNDKSHLKPISKRFERRTKRAAAKHDKEVAVSLLSLNDSDPSNSKVLKLAPGKHNSTLWKMWKFIHHCINIIVQK